MFLFLSAFHVFSCVLILVIPVRSGSNEIRRQVDSSSSWLNARRPQSRDLHRPLRPGSHVGLQRQPLQVSQGCDASRERRAPRSIWPFCWRMSLFLITHLFVFCLKKKTVVDKENVILFPTEKWLG